MEISSKHKIALIALISIAVLMVTGLTVTIVGMATNWNFRDFNFAKILPQQDGDTITEETSDENIVTAGTLPDLKEEDQNEWYTLYLPEYKFHIAYPSYILKANYIDGSWAYSRWTLDTDMGYENDRLGESIYNINLKFYPFVWTEAIEGNPDVACGYGCLNEQWVNVSIYDNADSKTLEEVGDMFIERSLEIADWSEASVRESSKWGKDVLIAQEPALGEGWDYAGYFVINDGYIYEISYVFNETEEPSSSKAFAEQIVNSIAFN